MNSILDIVTILCIGLLIGTEFAVSVFINPVLRKLDDQSQARAIRLFAKRLGTAMPFWYIASLLLLVAEAIVRRQQTGAELVIAANAIWAAVILVTVLVLVPINNRMMQLEGTGFPDEARQEHTKWDSLHQLRVAALVTALGCFLVAVHM